MNLSQTVNEAAIRRAFSKQASHYDTEDLANPILTDWRKQVYAHVSRFLKPESYILELNAGTGIDAMHFVKQGHRVHAIDISRGMLDQLESKKELNGLDQLTFQELSFENLAALNKGPFDYIFSNFGGLNCTNDLNKIAKHIPSVLKPGGYVTWVIMPPICLWEWLWIFKGHGRKAFRRLSKNGSQAQIEGEFFQTYYHSVSSIKESLGSNFQLIRLEGLGAVYPPPSKFELAASHPTFFRALVRIDRSVRTWFPFNQCADHIITTFRYGSQF